MSVTPQVSPLLVGKSGIFFLGGWVGNWRELGETPLSTLCPRMVRTKKGKGWEKRKKGERRRGHISSIYLRGFPDFQYNRRERGGGEGEKKRREIDVCEDFA